MYKKIFKELFRQNPMADCFDFWHVELPCTHLQRLFKLGLFLSYFDYDSTVQKAKSLNIVASLLNPDPMFSYRDSVGINRMVIN